MPKSRPPYAAAFRHQMVELVRIGRKPGELAREFAVGRGDTEVGRAGGPPRRERSDGLSTDERSR